MEMEWTGNGVEKEMEWNGMEKGKREKSELGG